MAYSAKNFAAAAFMLSLALCSAAKAQNAPACGNMAAGFTAWAQDFKRRAAERGAGKAALAALDHIHYAHGTIQADRSQKSFKLSFAQFMQKRGAETIIRRGRQLKQQNTALFARIEQHFGVPAGPLLAIWGMETAFGQYMGKQNTLSAVATLAYDCRRSAFFTDQLYAALELIDRGDLKPQTVGAMHGEIGQTQFLPRNALKYSVNFDGRGSVDLIGSRADALASTAYFLQAHGWRRGGGYQPGEPNFTAIQGWNKASVYQRAIAEIGRRIDAP